MANVGIFNSFVFLLFCTSPLVLNLWHLSKRNDRSLISPTAVFLLGILIFQVVSPFVTLLTGENYRFHILETEKTSFYFILYLYLFLFPFVFVNLKRTKKKKKLKEEEKDFDFVYKISGKKLLIFSGFLLFAGLFTSIFASDGSGSFTHFLSLASFAFLGGVGVVVGFLVARKECRQPIIIILAIVFAIFAAYFAYDGVFGRRPILNVLLGLVYGVSWARMFKLRVRSFIIVSVFCLGSFVFLSFLTGSRTHSSDVKLGIQKIHFTGDTFIRGIQLLFSGQDTGAASFWIIENFPDHEEVSYFQAPLYALVYPIPRAIWKNKPIPLSSRLHYYAGFRNDIDNLGSTRGPGIVGHGVAEGGVVTLMVYGIFLGWFFRVLDSMVLGKAARFPLIVSAGCGLGYVLGFARGDLGSAFWRWSFSFGIVFIFMRFLVFLFGRSMIVKTQRPKAIS